MIRSRTTRTAAALSGLLLFTSVGSASGAATAGPSSSDPPYLVPLLPGVTTESLLTVGDSPAGSSYRMVGIPDGLGAFDNGDGTFTVLMNHELRETNGVPRAHGSPGAFVSKWVVDTTTHAVVSGEDLIQDVYLADGDPDPDPTTFSRFCSADLAEPTAFYNPATDKGFRRGRLFLNGEESGTEGRAFAHVARGADAGKSYELPGIGNYSFENVVAHPATGDTTVVVGTDDSTAGQLYVYVGRKRADGNPVERAGLVGGRLFGVKASFALEDSATSLPDNSTFPFGAADLGDVSGLTGAELEALSATQGVTGWARPEDGAWDPTNPRDFYFATTASFTGRSRLWRLRFNNPADPAAGGEVQMVIEGPATPDTGPKMMDNLTVNDRRSQVVIQEDPGNQPYLAGVLEYDATTDSSVRVAEHDRSRFLTGGTNFMTQDEESSGIIPLTRILGKGWYLLDSQVHLAHPDPELVEHGQLLLLYVPPPARRPARQATP